MNNQWSTLLPPAPVGPPHQCKPERVLSFHTVESSTSSSPFHKIYQLSLREICAKSEALRPRRWRAFLTGWLLRGFATVRFSVRFNGDLFLFFFFQSTGKYFSQNTFLEWRRLRRLGCIYYTLLMANSEKQFKSFFKIKSFYRFLAIFYSKNWGSEGEDLC